MGAGSKGGACAGEGAVGAGFAAWGGAGRGRGRRRPTRKRDNRIAAPVFPRQGRQRGDRGLPLELHVERREIDQLGRLHERERRAHGLELRVQKPLGVELRRPRRHEQDVLPVGERHGLRRVLLSLVEDVRVGGARWRARGRGNADRRRSAMGSSCGCSRRCGRGRRCRATSGSRFGAVAGADVVATGAIAGLLETRQRSAATAGAAAQVRRWSGRSSSRSSRRIRRHSRCAQSLPEEEALVAGAAAGEAIGGAAAAGETIGEAPGGGGLDEGRGGSGAPLSLSFRTA